MCQIGAPAWMEAFPANPNRNMSEVRFMTSAADYTRRRFSRATKREAFEATKDTAGEVVARKSLGQKLAEMRAKRRIGP